MSSVVATDPVDQPAGGNRGQPRPWLVGNASLRPLGGGFNQRVLDGVLAEVEGMVLADKRAKNLGSKAPQQILDAPAAAHNPGPDSCKIGHTSTALCAAKGYSAAIAKARSSPSTSSRKKLETNSLAST